MNIHNVNVEGFGVWSGLELEGLSGDLNVLYGPNEAGKSTLVEFVRSMFYGFDEARHRRLLPPVEGGRPGGSLDIETHAGRFHLARYDAVSPADGSPADRFTLTAPDGTQHGEPFLHSTLCQVDEAIFNQVFAVGLKELQQLATLSDTEAAELLYKLTSGLDRVSLVDVMRELGASREHLLRSDPAGGRILDLIAKRDRLRREIDELQDWPTRFSALSRQKSRLGLEIQRADAEIEDCRRRLGVLEAAVTVQPLWDQLDDLDRQLGTMSGGPVVPEGAVARLEAIDRRLKLRRRQLVKARRQLRELREEAATLPINEALRRETPRIQALVDSQEMARSLETQVEELEGRLAGIESEQHEAGRRLGVDESGARALSQIRQQGLGPLRPAARAVSDARKKAAAAKQELARHEEDERQADEELRSTLSRHQVDDLSAALEEAGEQVSRLRRRVQLDERLEQLAGTRDELEEESDRFLGRQFLPGWVLSALGGLFVVGVLLVLLALFWPWDLGVPSGVLAVLGIVMAAGAVAGKILLERRSQHRQDANQQQLSMLNAQLAQAKEEREHLDGELPPGGGPLTARLQEAENRLKGLEELLPLDARRKSAGRAAAAARDELQRATGHYKSARQRWQRLLEQYGLSRDLSPKKIRELTSDFSRVDDKSGEADRLRRDLEDRRAALRSIESRIDDLMARVDVQSEGDSVRQRLAALRSAVDRQEQFVREREKLSRRARRIRKRGRRVQRSARRLRAERDDVLRSAGTYDESELRRLAERYGRRRRVEERRDDVHRELEAALRGKCTEQEVRELLAGEDVPSLEKRREPLAAQVREAELRRQSLYEQRGQLTEQMNRLAEDRAMPARQLELATVEERLRRAMRRWRVITLTGHLLDEVRRHYEQERQPETLRSASRFMTEMTEGRYTRVWTPLGEDVLRVDDRDGRVLPVEHLSQGTREQLFLCLRLALARQFAERGAGLPLVMDDLLVNFDARRAEAAARVLRDFAREGHQVLMFTCHEHLVSLFQSLSVTVVELPERSEPAQIRIEAPQPKKKSRRKPKQEKQAPPPPVEDEQPPAEPSSDEDDDSRIELAAVANQPPDEQPEDEDQHLLAETAQVLEDSDDDRWVEESDLADDELEDEIDEADDEIDEDSGFEDEDADDEDYEDDEYEEDAYDEEAYEEDDDEDCEEDESEDEAWDEADDDQWEAYDEEDDESQAA